VNPGGGPAQPRGPGPIDRDLPPDLKPFEAALASLSPSADRLEYDLIMFRAGQRRAARAARRASRAWSLVMPAALLATSAAAATLLVMLLTRPIIERVQVVRVPAAEPSGTGVEQPGGGEHPSQLVQDGSPLPGRYEQGLKPRWPSHTSNVRHSDRLSHFQLGPFRSRTVSLEVFDRMLQQDVDPWPRQVAVPAEAVPPPKAPVPYLQQLRDILDDQARAKAPGGRSNILLTRGAES
jgi:hypothetical protein